MYDLRYLVIHSSSNQTEKKGKWVPVRPMELSGFEGFMKRCKDAWKVLTGRADAFRWPEGQ